MVKATCSQGTKDIKLTMSGNLSNNKLGMVLTFDLDRARKNTWRPTDRAGIIHGKAKMLPSTAKSFPGMLPGIVPVEPQNISGMMLCSKFIQPPKITSSPKIFSAYVQILPGMFLGELPGPPGKFSGTIPGKQSTSLGIKEKLTTLGNYKATTGEFG